MPLVLIHTQAPWGPISFKTADSMAELLARLTERRNQAPAHIEDVGERDPAEVVRQALRLLPPPFDATGQIPATVAQASQIIAQAALPVPLAMVVAADPEIDSYGHPAAIAGHVSVAYGGGGAGPELLEATWARGARGWSSKCRNERK